MYGLSEREWQDLVLSLNVHRKSRRLSPYETACFLDRALAQTDVQSLAQALGFSDVTTLHKILRLKQMPAEIAPLVEWGTSSGTVSMSTATELMRLPSIDLTVEAVEAAVQHSFTKEEARQLVQVFQRSARPLDQCISNVLETRPRIEKSELILGSLVSAEAQRRARLLGDEPTAKRLRLLLARQYPDVICRALRVKAGRFSLLLSEDNAAKFRQQLAGEAIEAKLTSLLESVALED